ncbi:hypothetical protein QTG54_003371 [Skeletonema marinoi]|uniref:Glycosyltransferase family 32 protein n=1 Tax=Skeletonema marinoi TaxID=267567 RepID=A0AAD8YHN2_9STRA|nr:hypothetical protein QTG54_003371 [Skeletonema marinoi]
MRHNMTPQPVCTIHERSTRYHWPNRSSMTIPSRSFIKIGLAVTVAYNFAWIFHQHAKLLADPGSSNVDHLMISPDQFDTTLLYNSTSISSSSSRIKSTTTSSLDYSHPNDPRGKSLPLHPTPNYELQQLVSSHTPQYTCSNGLIYIQDHILPDNITHYDIIHPTTGQLTPRKIPRLLHFTSKSRCMTQSFANNLQLWKDALGSKYSIYIHDDAAINKFIYHRRWVEFPELQELMSCITAGAAKADVWRYLMIWEYGGIYSDMDSAPNKFDVDTITTEDDAWFPLEMLGIPAQYWFAASPRHPIMYFSAKSALGAVAWRPDISNNNAAKTTGPGAFKVGFVYFQRLVGDESSGYVTEGLYHGVQNRTVKVVGTKENANEWIQRESIRGKSSNYEQMGMTHFHQTRGKFREMHSMESAVGCLMQRYRMHTDVLVGWDNVV